ncbi:GDSL-type esterase/lipase family protein [Thalassoglobus sp. JC818]|uniref:GDSL-type esterase/lipase family protein n=1 Tax=Thalassoglobus sp. JC818 TaxID=3232136 RepID=UPI00345B0C33
MERTEIDSPEHPVLAEIADIERDIQLLREMDERVNQRSEGSQNAPTPSERPKLTNRNIWPLLSLSLNMLLLAGGFSLFLMLGGVNWLQAKLTKVDRKAGYATNRESFFECSPVSEGDIVVVGDSQLDFVEWHELLGSEVRNRAVNGAVLAEIQRRLSEIVDCRPRCVIVNGGINDFQGGRDVEEVKQQFRSMLTMLANKDFEIILVPCFPINSRIYHEQIVRTHPRIHPPEQAEVGALAELINEVNETSSKVHVVDISPFLNGEGELAEEYTFDGLHINGSAAVMLADQIRGILETIPTASAENVATATE